MPLFTGHRTACWLLCLGVLFTPSVDARIVPLYILHTTDVHGHLLPSTDYDGRENMGGLLRCASLIEAERAKSDNVLLVDCGDFFQGSAESYVTQGAVLLKAFKWLKYDAVVVGNHEFDWGGEFLRALIREDEIPLLAGNIILQDKALQLAAYRMKIVDGVRVAIVGLSTPGIPRWFRPETLKGYRIERSIKALARIMPQVRNEKPDLTILVAHMGYPAFGRQRKVNEIELIARAVPEFDVILGGHTHRALAHENVNGMVYGQAGYHAIWLGKVEISYDTVTKKVIRKVGSLLHVTPDVPVHESLEKELTAELHKARTELARSVGVVGKPFTLNESMPGLSDVQQLLCRAIDHAHSCDVVFHGALNDRETLLEGPLLERDLFRVVPYDNEIGIAQLTRANMRDILEENTQQWGRHHFLGVWGLRYSLTMKNSLGDRVSDLRLWNGKALHGRKRYAVGMNSFDLASAGGRFPVLRSIVDDPKSRLWMTGTLTRDALRTLIASCDFLSPTNRAEVIKK